MRLPIFARVVALLSVMTVVCLAHPAFARTWQVLEDGSGDAPTIQAGIDSASHGDTVFVEPGTYFENINLLGKSIVLRGAGTSLSTIDGSRGDSSVITIDSGEGGGTVVEHLTVTGGAGTSLGGATRLGGGFLVLDSEPTIRHNVIVDNSAVQILLGETHGHGGGIFVGASPGFVRRPRIEQNTIARNQCAILGGGISVTTYAAPEIVGNRIENNTATEGDGGGISLWLDAGFALVRDNRIAENTAGDRGGGIHAALLSSNAQLDVSYNFVLHNLAEGDPGFAGVGGGLWASGENTLVHHNTIVNNRSMSGQGISAGLATRQQPGCVLESDRLLCR